MPKQLRVLLNCATIVIYIYYLDAIHAKTNVAQDKLQVEDLMARLNL